MPGMERLNNGLMMSLKENRVHSVIDFLERPLRIADGLWTTTDTLGEELLSMNIPEDVVSETMYSEKMRGFLGFRATAVIRVLINPQPFQQGRLLLHYFPQGQINIKRRQVANASLPLRTQLPRVELDCESANEAILEMPYVSPTTHYNLIDGTGPIGRFMLCVYSPLQIGQGTDGVNYSVYISFKDIDLSFPTAPYNETALALKRQEQRLRDIGVLMPKDKFNPSVWTAQARGVSKNAGRGKEGEGPQAAEEKSLVGGGPISNALSTVSKVATVFGDVPLLSAVAKPVAWAAGIGSKVAAAFGWSSPRCTGSVTKMVGQRFFQMQNVNNLDKSQTLGLDGGNVLRELPGFAGTDIDEMSLDYVSRIPSYIYTTSWSTASAADAIVYDIAVGPSTARLGRVVANGGAGVQVYDHAPFSYVANYFKYWRGSITYTFKVVKTKFHSGRLIVSFLPGTSEALDINWRSYLYREIYDIQESGEFKVTIPWVSTTQWKLFSQTTGILSLQVLNPLVAVDTVSNTVDIIVEVSAGPDFQVACPDSTPAWLPLATVDVGATFSSTKSADTVILTGLRKNRYEAQCNGTIWQAQVEGGSVVEQNKTSTIDASLAPIASSDVSSAGLTAAEYTIGEGITSLRQLVKRFSMWMGTGGASASLFLRPGQIMLPYIQTGSAVTGIVFHTDWFSAFGAMYAYRRGSTRIKAGYEPASAALSADTVLATYLTYDTSTANADTSASLNGACSQYAFFRELATGGAEVELPHYGKTHVYNNFLDSVTAVSSENVYRDFNAILMRGSSNWNAATKNGVRVMRAAGDDLSFGFFVGVMPLVARATVEVGSYGTW